MKKSAAKKPSKTKPSASGGAKEADPRWQAIARAFLKDSRVKSGGKGFGAGALKVDGKIFAMISSKGAFVVKLPAARVDQLVELERGRHFDPGRGKLMKEWLESTEGERAWLALAKEARRFVGDGA